MLRFVLPFCVCLHCRVAAARAEVSVLGLDEMVREMESGEIGGEGPVGWRGLPGVEEMRMLGEVLEGYEFQLGTVSRISARGAKVVFEPFVKMLFEEGWRYCGGIDMNMEKVSEIVMKKAREHFRLWKGKTERRFYIRGTLIKFLIDGAGICMFNYQDGIEEGILFRRQVVSMFSGQLALEDSFGSFLDINDSKLYIGFGHDPFGAQSILEGECVASARHLGINELRHHMHFNGHEEIEVRLR